MVDFSYPLVLLFYFLVLIATIYIFLKNQKRLIFSSTNTNVRKNLFKRIDIKRILLKDRLVFLSLVLMIFAASGPKIGTRIAPIERTGIDLVFAIDVSSSMKAEDVKPSRIQKAKFENKPSNYSDLISAIDSMEKRKINVEIFSEYQDYYQIFTMLSLICLFLGTILGDKKIPSQNWKGRYVN